MGRKIYQRTVATDAKGGTHIYQPGDEVPDEIAELITNPNVWEKPEDEEFEGPLGLGDATPSPPFAGVQDPPWVEHPAPFLPDTGPVVETGSNVLVGSAQDPDSETPTATRDGGSSETVSTAGVRPSPAALDRMTRAQLDLVASNLGLDVHQSASKPEVRSAIDSADARDEGDFEGLG